MKQKIIEYEINKISQHLNNLNKEGLGKVLEKIEALKKEIDKIIKEK